MFNYGTEHDTTKEIVLKLNEEIKKNNGVFTEDMLIDAVNNMIPHTEVNVEQYCFGDTEHYMDEIDEEVYDKIESHYLELKNNLNQKEMDLLVSIMIRKEEGLNELISDLYNSYKWQVAKDDLIDGIKTWAERNTSLLIKDENVEYNTFHKQVEEDIALDEKYGEEKVREMRMANMKVTSFIGGVEMREDNKNEWQEELTNTLLNAVSTLITEEEKNKTKLRKSKTLTFKSK